MVILQGYEHRMSIVLEYYGKGIKRIGLPFVFSILFRTFGAEFKKRKRIWE